MDNDGTAGPEDGALRAELETRLRFEALLADLSSRFVNLPADEVDREIEEAQRRVCEFLGFDVSVLWQWNAEGVPVLTLTHVYRRFDGPPPPDPMDAHEHFPWSLREVLAGRTIASLSPDDLPAEAAKDRATSLHFGIKTSLAIPLAAGGGPPLGVLSFNTVLEQRPLRDEIVNRLRLVAQVFANALARRHADQALRKGEARLAQAVEAAGLGFCEVADGSRINHLDERARAMFGIPHDLAHGAQGIEFWLAHIHPDDRWRMDQWRKRLYSGPRDRMSAEYRYFHPRDGERWIQHSVRVLRRGADGKETLSLAVSRDVTDGKHAEIETQKLRTALTHSHRVSLLGQLVAALAHELNQPLAAILANTQAAQRFLAGDGADPGEIAGILDDIVRDDKRAGNILHNLRALVSKRPPARRACCLNEVVRQVVEMTRGEMILRGIDTRVALAPGPAAVEGVCVELQQVVMNLLLNAAQAVAGSPPGGRTVEIETRCAEGEAVVVIRDRGPGIPPDRMPRIFELFYSTKEDGLGAGLAIVRRIVTDHGGCVAARNHEAGGAEFTVVLPVARTSPGP